MNKHAIPQDSSDFSLVLGGPLFHLFRRSRLSGDALELVRRRILVIVCATWLPLLLLSVVAGHAFDDTGGVPFLHDIECHVRLLIALPILIAAERHVHLSIRPIVAPFVEQRIVAPEDLPKFQKTLESVARVRNSVLVEVALVVLVYTLGHWVWQREIALSPASWYALPGDDGQMRLTAAGYWCFLFSLPVLQFILLRWYLRFVLWCWCLWRISRLNLRLVPTHPDGTAGLGFFGKSSNAFVPILAAHGAMLSGFIAGRVFYADQELVEFKLQIAGAIAFFVAFALFPLIVFVQPLAQAKQRALREIDKLARRYACAFEEKWLGENAPPESELLGSGDIQSLADLGTSYGNVQQMRVVPFSLKDAGVLVAITAAPLLPLTLTMFSPEEVLARLLKVVF